jgi:16S rRNA (guanine966-N2)-methyltransferase
VRIVAGSARGRVLVAPPGRTTRPTSDKVRQAIFNALTSLDLVDDARMVDLFAGSGALGVEALSRGAAHVTFVERDRAALAAIDANLALVGGERRVERVDVDRFLATTTDRFEVALIDPPYAFADWPSLLARVPAPFVVLESDRPIDPGPEWEIVRSRSYGGTVVVFARRAGPEE